MSHRLSFPPSFDPGLAQEQADTISGWRDRLKAAEQHLADAAKQHADAEISHASSLATWQQRWVLRL